MKERDQTMFSKSRGKLFGGRIEPACEYCELGNRQETGDMILCAQRGVVAPYYSCRKFVYAPLKRIPSRPRALPQYSPDDFQL